MGLFQVLLGPFVTVLVFSEDNILNLVARTGEPREGFFKVDHKLPLRPEEVKEACDVAWDKARAAYRRQDLRTFNGNGDNVKLWTALCDMVTRQCTMSVRETRGILRPQYTVVYGKEKLKIRGTIGAASTERCDKVKTMLAGIYNT